MHLLDGDLLHLLGDLGDEGIELREDEHLSRVLPRRGERLAHRQHRCGRRDALLALKRRPAVREELRALSLRLGWQDHLALETRLLELLPHPLQLLLRLGARLLGRHLGLALDRLRGALELTDERAQLVALLRDADLGVLLGELRRLPRRGRLLLELLVGLVLGVLGVAQGVGDPRARDVHEVLRLVLDALDLQRVEVQAQLVEDVARRLEELVGELDAVLVHLLGRELGDDVPQGAFERLLGGHVDGGPRERQEALDRVVGVLRVARDLDVRDRVHVEGDAAVREDLRDDELDRDEAHVHARHRLH